MASMHGVIVHCRAWPLRRSSDVPDDHVMRAACLDNGVPCMYLSMGVVNIEPTLGLETPVFCRLWQGVFLRRVEMRRMLVRWVTVRTWLKRGGTFVYIDDLVVGNYVMRVGSPDAL
jgi:hypothetical protein